MLAFGGDAVPDTCDGEKNERSIFYSNSRAMGKHSRFVHNVRAQKAIILYDIQEDKIYAYPYKEFKAELSKKSQVSLERDYKAACTTGRMVVFVRDNRERKLVSYTLSMTA